MMNIKTLILIMGFAIISACASNEATMDDGASKAEAAKDESVATMEESKADMQEMKEEVKEETSEASAEVTKTAAAAETEVATSTSDNKTSTCEHGNQVRTITVVYDNEATDTVCEVNYEKSTGVQTLWSANSERDYCMDKATAFVEKQEGWGWTCSSLE